MSKEEKNSRSISPPILQSPGASPGQRRTSKEPRISSPVPTRPQFGPLDDDQDGLQRRRSLMTHHRPSSFRLRASQDPSLLAGKLEDRRSRTPEIIRSRTPESISSSVEASGTQTAVIGLQLQSRYHQQELEALRLENAELKKRVGIIEGLLTKVLHDINEAKKAKAERRRSKEIKKEIKRKSRDFQQPLFSLQTPVLPHRDVVPYKNYDPLTGCYSHPGTRYDVLNQDSYLAFTVKNANGKTVHIWGVFDGHSLFGEEASSIAASTVQDYLTDRISGASTAISKNMLRDAFRTAHLAILDAYTRVPDKYGYPTGDGAYAIWTVNRLDGTISYMFKGKVARRVIEFGTTALVVVKEEDQLLVANAGDCRCVLVSEDSDLQFVAEELSKDHNAWCNKAEVERIRASYDTKFKDDGYIVGGNGEELAVTRALGHRAFFDKGVIHEPEFTERRLQGTDQFLLLGSDGVWENLTSAEAAEVVGLEDDPEDAARALVQQSMSLNEVEDDVDNTTAIVVLLV